MHLQIIWCITYNVVWGLALHFFTTVTKLVGTMMRIILL
jgi:hypothetical protein